MIDITTDVGKVRFRVGDISDIPYLDDSVYASVIASNNNNLYSAAKECAQYILAILSTNTHTKVDQLEVFGSDAYKNYKDFLVMLTRDPSFNSISLTPYAPITTQTQELVNFKKYWDSNYYDGTQLEDLKNGAAIGSSISGGLGWRTV